MSGFQDDNGGFKKLSKTLSFSGGPRLDRKVSFRGDPDIDDTQFRPLSRPGSFAESKTPSQYARFRSQSFGSVGDVNEVPPPTDVEMETSRTTNFKFRPADERLTPGDGYVIIVDAFSTGAYISHVLCEAGYSVLSVLSADLRHLQELVSKNLSYKYMTTIEFNEHEEDALEKLVGRIKAFTTLPILAVLAGAETGVILADMLSERLGLRTNGTNLSEARRDKYIMGETVRSAGVRAVKQMMSSNLQEIKTYIEEWNPSPFKVIMKPVNSAGSDGVTLCTSMTEIEKTFNMLIGKTNGLGLSNVTVLVQEYLTGTEYVVDMVSMDGVHKCVALWEYDRRAINGAGFVCMGQRLLCDDEERVAALVDYEKKVLDALGIFNGPSHGEVKWHEGEPVLVEVGARCHGAEGLWVPVEDAVYNYNQVDLTCSSYLNPPQWELLPVAPSTRYGYGNVLFIVSYQSGTIDYIVKEILDEIRNFASYRGMEMFVKEGSEIKATTDCFTWLGNLQLCHVEKAVVDRDIARLREIETKSLLLKLK